MLVIIVNQQAISTFGLERLNMCAVSCCVEFVDPCFTPVAYLRDRHACTDMYVKAWITCEMEVLSAVERGNYASAAT